MNMKEWNEMKLGSKETREMKIGPMGMGWERSFCRVGGIHLGATYNHGQTARHRQGQNTY